MQIEPFSREGMRKFMMTTISAETARRLAANSGFGWVLVVVGLAIGIGVVNQIVAANSNAVDVEAPQAHNAPSADFSVSDSEAINGEAEIAESVAATRSPDPEHLPHATDYAADYATNQATNQASDDAVIQPDEIVAKYVSVPIDSLPIHEQSGEVGAADSLTIVTHGEIGLGDSLGSSMRQQGISPGTVHLIASEMRKVFDFRRSRPGDVYRLGQDSDGRVLDFRYAQGPEESFYLAWEGARYVVRKETAELRPQIAKIAGVVDSSFYGAVRALGEQSALAAEFARILAWDIDFSRNVHPGDEFQILYERLYRRDDDGREVYVRPGRILAGRYGGNIGEHTVVYFEDDRGIGAYFRPDGSSVERAFLAAPLEFSRISSRFTKSRKHPILHVKRAHPGIDYAAPQGTPIWAVADGVVEYRARAGASGNLIRIRHAGGYTSHYAHLSKFAAGLNVGDHVDQKELIGYVGSTGLSTGPHVCFRVKKDGRYVDPMRISSPAGDPVAVEKRIVFESVRDQLLADLGPGPVSVVDEAL